MPAGRPTLFELEPEILDELELHLRNGNYIETACDFLGIWSMDLRVWMRRGRVELRRMREAKIRLEKEQLKLTRPRLRGDARRRIEGTMDQMIADCECRPLEAKYVDLHRRIKRAMGQSVIGAIGIINRAALGQPATETTEIRPDGTQIITRTAEVKPQWQAAAWRLERTRGRDFARPQPQQVALIGGGKDDPPVQVDANLSGGVDVVFYIPDNGRAPLPQGSDRVRGRPHVEQNQEPGEG